MVFQHERVYQRLVYQLLREAAITLYINNDILADDICWLEANGYRINSFDYSVWNDELSIHSGFAEQLEFPRITEKISMR